MIIFQNNVFLLITEHQILSKRRNRGIVTLNIIYKKLVFRSDDIFGKQGVNIGFRKETHEIWNNA